MLFTYSIYSIYIHIGYYNYTNYRHAHTHITRNPHLHLLLVLLLVSLSNFFKLNCVYAFVCWFLCYLNFKYKSKSYQY